ncbi:MAG TPA: hypothetical protein VIK31_14070 [Propionibacteriaceae bacterium]
MNALDRLDVAASELVREHPPAWSNANKHLVYEIACPRGAEHRGRIGYSRWEATPLPVDVSPVPTDLVVARPGFYDYAPILDPVGAVEWHVNFADPHLFVAYAGVLFAQDEMQVAEHPALGALREALDAAGIHATTLDRDGPTPILVTGVERRVSIQTGPDPEAGRPRGIYGNGFARAHPEVVRRATSPIVPPTISNLIAISAPPGGYGRYTDDEIRSILATAYTGFRAAAVESVRLQDQGTRVAVHSGYWGCGAFGGNRVLMALLQVVAAGMAGLDRLAFHMGGMGGDAPLDTALGIVDDLLGGEPLMTRALIDELVGMGFAWGVSDGN